MTKYPVVLVHGMMIRDFRFYRSFRVIEAYLRENGVSVYISNQDALGTIATNALQLKKEIEEICRAQGCDKVNIIAHSKGGLDARYLISTLGMHTCVASLTTLSTPHHGSRMSRKILGMPALFAKFISFFANLFYKICGDKSPDIYALANEITDTAMLEFNEKNKDIDTVFYQSFAAKIANEKDYIAFLPRKISEFLENESTDGVVSYTSSIWGEHAGDMDCNHFRMVGLYGSRKNLAGICDFYLKVASDLAQRGF